jgi:hypothetical protein
MFPRPYTGPTLMFPWPYTGPTLVRSVAQGRMEEALTGTDPEWDEGQEERSVPSQRLR